MCNTDNSNFVDRDKDEPIEVNHVRSVSDHIKKMFVYVPNCKRVNIMSLYLNCEGIVEFLSEVVAQGLYNNFKVNIYKGGLYMPITVYVLSFMRRKAKKGEIYKIYFLVFYKDDERSSFARGTIEELFFEFQSVIPDKYDTCDILVTRIEKDKSFLLEV